MNKDLRVIKNILLILVVIVLAYLLKILSFLFVPLALALFITLLFLPLLNWFQSKKIPYFIGLSVIVMAGLVVLREIGEIVQHTALQITERKEFIIAQFYQKLAPLIERTESWFGVGYIKRENTFIEENFEKVISSSAIAEITGTTIESTGGFISSFLLFLIFLVFMLIGSSHINKYISFIAGNKKKK